MRQWQNNFRPSVPVSLTIRCARVLLLPCACLQSALESHFGSHIRVSGTKGRSSSFEVNVSIETAMGVASQPALIHSKLQNGNFPDTPALIAQIQQWAQTGKVA